MNPNSSLNLMLNFVNIIPRTHYGQFRVGLRCYLGFWKSQCSTLHDTRFRFFNTLQEAPNLRLSKVYTKSIMIRKKSQNLTYQSKLKQFHSGCIAYFSGSESMLGVDKSISAPLTKRQAQDLILRLTGEERSALLCALQEFQSEKMKAEYEGQLAGYRWRSKFGRPSKLPRLGDVDPTGSYCAVPEDWLRRKYAETVPPPTTTELWRVGLHNALPFIGFGFLDNFFMILAGDQIEMTMGTMMVLSTMAAAALGNTISDVLGIGSAWYVERMAAKVGMRAPELTPIQLDMSSSRIATNMGRVIGVIIGCLMGMIPLLFIGNKKKESEAQEEKPT